MESVSFDDASGCAEVVAVCISTGGVPKLPVAEAQVVADGLVGDGHNHEKHRRPHRAVTIQDIEILELLKAEGYPVGPGVLGENFTVRGLNVQQRCPGEVLCFENGPIIELTEVRRPCYVLDAIHPALQEAARHRCGYLGRVLREGRVFPGQRILLCPPTCHDSEAPVAAHES
jgi:MOSC domain-containing protein YiiM